MKTNLLDFTLPALTTHFAELGEKAFRAKQVMRWMHQMGTADFDAMTDLAKSLRAKLETCAEVRVPSLMTSQASVDGTRKWLLDVGTGKVRVNKAGCLDRCAAGPVAVVYPEGTWYTFVDTSDIDEIVESHLKNGQVVERLLVPPELGR